MTAFSARTGWSGVANRWSALRDEMEAEGLLLDLTATDPTRCGIPYPEEEILSALADRRALRHEPEPFGLPAAREAVAAEYAAAGVSIDPGRIGLTASTSESYAFLFKLLADPGDTVLVPRPGYPLFEFLGGLESVRTESYLLDADDGWSIDLADLSRAGGAGSRALVLVSPGNPTGSLLRAAQWGPVQQLARERGWAVIADEVFAPYVVGDGAGRVRCAAAEAGEALTFSLGGLSKSCGLPQCKLGWFVVGGPPEQAREAMARLEVIADTYLSVAAPVQWALPRLLAAGRAVRREIRARVAANRGLLEALAAGSACRVVPAEGGWAAILEVPRTRTEEEWAVALLREDRVAAHPGYFYDFPREAYLVLSLLPEEPVFREAAGRIVARVAAEV